jgi:hypothetical protein
MAAIGKVSAVFTASTGGLTQGVSRAAASMRQMESAVGSLSGSMRSLVAIQGAQLFGSIAASASNAIGSLVRMGQAQAEVVDQTSKLAARLGMTYGEFSGLALAGDLAGVSMDTIASAATKADLAFVKAANGSKTAQAALASVGLSVEQLNGLSASDRFDAIAESVSQLPTEAERAAAAVALFGRSGAQLLPLFAGGASAIAEARAEAERFGLALTNAQGQDVEAMNDAFTRAQKAVEGVVQQVVAYLAPAVESVTTAFSDLVGSIGGANIGQAIGDGILQGARFLAGVGDFIIQNFSSVFSFFSSVGEQWGAVADFMNRAANFMSGVFNAAQAGLGMIVLGFSGAFEGLARIAQNIGQFLGFDTSSLDAVVAGAAAFNASISDGITKNMQEAQQGFSAAFAESTAPVGQAIAGPLTTALDSAIAEAQDSASQIDQASTAPVEVKQTVEFNNEAVKGVDSRSSEGVKEMFRLMRSGDNVQEQQLAVLEQIAQNTNGATEDDLVAEF